MYRIATAVVFMFSAWASTSASACSYPDPPSFREVLKNSTSVFVFRLERAEFRREMLGASAVMDSIEGEVTLLQTLYGNPTGCRRLRYYSGWCGGVNLVVGHSYLIVTRARGDTIELTSADQSIIDIEGFYDERNKKDSLRSPLIFPVIQAKYGVRPLPEDFPPLDIAGRVGLLSLPPPPPPPPSPIQK